MKVALADKPAMPFRVPPGIKLIRVDARPACAPARATARSILEAFKPGTAPPDSYSVVGDRRRTAAAPTGRPSRSAPDRRGAARPRPRLYCTADRLKSAAVATR